MPALLLVDHGSRREEANENLSRAAEVVREQAPGLDVFVAHMELSMPDIAAAFDACAKAGHEELIVFPWFLAEGRHVREDIPQLCKEAGEKTGIRYRIASPFGVDEHMAAVALTRAGLHTKEEAE
ncbi:MAG: sirohydrochlorin chelatase [Polyangiales bacterium]